MLGFRVQTVPWAVPIRTGFAEASLSWVSFTLLLISAGCRPGNELERFHYHGNVTINGSPCRVFELSFEPDPESGGSGPAVLIQGENGIYDSRSGKGVPPGPKVIRIRCFDGVPVPESKDGTLLTKMDCQQNVVLPNHDAVQDIVISPEDLMAK